jgi:hypothetical protein
MLTSIAGKPVVAGETVTARVAPLFARCAAGSRPCMTWHSRRKSCGSRRRRTPATWTAARSRSRWADRGDTASAARWPPQCRVARSAQRPGVVSISSRIRWITGRTGVVAERLTGTSFADPL